MPIANRKYVADAINKKLGKGLLSATSPGEAANKYYLARMIDIANAENTAYGQTAFNGGEMLRAVNTDSVNDAMRLVLERAGEAGVVFGAMNDWAVGGRIVFDGYEKSARFESYGDVAIAYVPSINDTTSCIGGYIYGDGAWPPAAWFGSWGWSPDILITLGLQWWGNIRGWVVHPGGGQQQAVIDNESTGYVYQRFVIRCTARGLVVDQNSGVTSCVRDQGLTGRARLVPV